MLDELIGFCPSPRDRANLGRVLQATNRVLDKARDLTEKRIETLTSESELDKLVNRMVPPIPRAADAWKFIYQCAGALGLDPGPLTLRELVAMLDGRQRHDWSIAAAVMSVVANTARDPKRSRLLKPADFDPFHCSPATRQG